MQPRVKVRPLFRRLAATLLVLTASGFSRAQTSEPVALTVQVDKPLHKVSKTLCGLMTEEINYSYDGGLYAEMVRNRTLNARLHAQPMQWFLQPQGDARASMQVDDSQGPSEALQSSLLLDVTKADVQQQAGVDNEGYWGMAVQPNTTYTGSFYAKADANDFVLSTRIS